MTDFNKTADAELDDYLKRLDTSDAQESGKGGARVKNLGEKIAAIRERRERCKYMLADLDRTGENKISLIDPDRLPCARSMTGDPHRKAIRSDH